VKKRIGSLIVMPRIYFSIAILLVLQACSHPLEIVGEGDIVDLKGSGHGCMLEQHRIKEDVCTKNFVVFEYDVDYKAIPKEGWEFVGWQGVCENRKTSSCPLKISRDIVTKNWFKTMPPTVAVFKPISLLHISGAAMDKTNRAIYFTSTTHDNVIKYDLASGDLSLLSSKDKGVGPDLFSPSHIAIDSLGGKAFVFDHVLKSIFRIDLITGDREIISTEGDGYAFPVFTSDIAFNSNSRDRLYIVDTGYAHTVNNEPNITISEVNITTGQRYLLSNNSNSGPSFSFTEELLFDSSKNRLIVPDTNIANLVGVDISSGNKSVILDFPENTNADLNHTGSSKIGDLDLANNRFIALEWGSFNEPYEAGAVVAYDLTDGSRSFLYPTPDVNEVEVFLDNPTWAFFDSILNSLYVVDTSSDGISTLSAIDLDTLSREKLLPSN
jgi:hypothetical protein